MTRKTTGSGIAATSSIAGYVTAGGQSKRFGRARPGKGNSRCDRRRSGGFFRKLNPLDAFSKFQSKQSFGLLQLCFDIRG